MSVSDEEPYSTIFASLKHPIRRRILRMLSKKPMSFSEMVGVLGVSSSFLTYHLENLGELVGKIDDGKYKLSSFGEAAIATMTKVEDIPISAPQQSPETKSKKVVGRSVTIALGIICILLIAGLVGVFTYYTMAYNNKNSAYDDYVSSHSHSNSDYDSLNSQIASKDSQISQLNSNATNLQNQVNNLTDILDLNKSTIWYKGTLYIVPTPQPNMLEENASYAGYVSVQVYLSQGNETVVKLIYYSEVLQYRHEDSINLSSGGTAIFPVLPSSVSIYFYDPQPYYPETATVKITYYY